MRADQNQDAIHEFNSALKLIKELREKMPDVRQLANDEVDLRTQLSGLKN